jgi:O-antigen/teichoic acid export membrane protein
MGAKPFLKGLSWLLFLNLLIKPAWIFLVDRRVQNIVGHETYGVYFALFNFTYILLFLADAGLTNMLAQRLAATTTLPVRQLLVLKLSLLGIYAVVCMGLAFFTGIKQWDVLLYLVLIQGLFSLFLFLRGILTAQQLFMPDAFFSVLDKSLLLLFCIGPVYGLFRPITMQLFLQLQLLSISAAAGSLLYFLWQGKKLPQGEAVALRKIAGWASPFILLILLMSAHNRLDAFLLERLHPDGAVQAGIYAMAYRLLDASNMLGYLTASFLLPFLSRNQNNPRLVQQVVLVSRHGLLLFSMMTVAFFAVFASWLQEVLYHSADPYSNRVLVLTMAVLPAYYLIHLYGTVLTAVAAFRLFIGSMLFAVCSNVLLNLWLIPQYGALGCAIAALVSQYSCGLWLWAVATRKLKIPASILTAVLYPSAALIFGLLFYAGKKLTEDVWITLASIAAFVLALLLAGRSFIKKTFQHF